MMKKVVLPLLLMTMTLSAAAQYDTLRTLPYYGEQLVLQNLRYGSSNPTSVRTLPYNALTDMQLSYTLDGGAFRPVDGSLKSRLLDVDIYGLQRIGRTTFEGSLSYGNHALTDQVWNGTLLTSPHNPFIVADTLSLDTLTSDVDRETFHLDGAFAYVVSDRLVAALRADYTVGSKADQTDPRGIAEGSRFIFNPGIEYRLGNSWSLGLAGNVGIYHEDIKYTAVRHLDSENTILLIGKALGGFESKGALGYVRRYNGTTFGGSLQAVWEAGQKGNFLDLSFAQNTEKAVDGGTEYIYLGGDFGETQLRLSDRFSVASGQVRHNLLLNAAFDYGLGTWHKQKQTYDENRNVIWDIVASEVTHVNMNLDATLAYRLDLTTGGTSWLTGKVYGGFASATVTEYPDEYHASYGLAKVGADITRRWEGNRFPFSLSAGGSYRKAVIPLVLDVATPKPADLRYHNGFTLPRWQYLAADAYDIHVKADVAFPVKFDATVCWLKAFAAGSMAQYVGDWEGLAGSRRLAATMGIQLLY